MSHETVRAWWNRFGQIFASEIKKRRAEPTRSRSNWNWHLDEVFVNINGETHYLWRAVDHEGEVLEVFVTKRRNRGAALKFLRKAMRRYGQPKVIVTDDLRSYRTAMKEIGNENRQMTGRWMNKGLRIHIYHSDDENEQWQNLDVLNHFKNLLRSAPQFTTISIENAI